MTTTFRNRQGQPLSLVLYMFESCPYCQRVLHAAKKLGFELPRRDTRRDPAALAELVKVGGSKQVPCLFIDGKPLYESADIIHFLQTEVVA